jgi:Tol biopolymer transport system component
VSRYDNSLATLIEDENYNHQPIWSPDGRVIVYLSSPPKTQSKYVVFVNLDGSCPAKSGRMGWVDIALSPDGLYLAATRHGNLYRLKIKDLMGREIMPGAINCQQ